MYTIFLLAAIGLLVGGVIGLRSERNFGNALICSVFFGLIGAFMGTLAADVILDFVPRHDVVYGQTTLVAMRTSDGTSGSFVWGSGSINSLSTYSFLYRSPDGSLTPGQVPANSLVHIIEDASLQGVGYWSTTYSEADFSAPLARWAVVFSYHKRLIRQEFRVPVGTVVQSISIK